MSADTSTLGLNLFGGLLFYQVFFDLASALRWMFWGWVLQLFAVALMIAGFAVIALRLPAAALLATFGFGTVVWLIASFVVLRGQFKCLHLEAPSQIGEIPGRRWIQVAYFCEMSSILLRVLRIWVGRGVLGLLILPLELLSLVFLLLFLRKIADVLARGDLRRWIDVVLGSIATSILCGVSFPILVQFKEQLGRPATATIGIAVIAVGGCALIGAIAGYGIVLWRMSSAARLFGNHLLSSYAWGEEVESEPAPADS